VLKARSQNLRIEPLMVRHLISLKQPIPSPLQGSLQSYLMKGWIAELESALKGFLPAKQPRCLIALENNIPICFVISKPNNRKGTCWLIEIPISIGSSCLYSSIQIKKLLVQQLIQQKGNKIQNWIVDCPVMDTEHISLFRELGFQPLKIYKSWSSNYSQNELKTLHINNLKWEKLNRDNASLLFKIEQSSESVHLRQILDRQNIDLLSNNKNIGGVLLSQNDSNKVAIAGLVHRNNNENEFTFELLREFTWDQRLEGSIPKLIKYIYTNHPKVKILTNSDDEKLNNVLLKSGCIQNREDILLGRSIWKRKQKSTLIKGTKSLDELISSLNPRHPPLPTPTPDQISEN